MEGALRGVVGLGVTLLVLAAGMAAVNGVARAWGAKRLQDNPNDQWAQAVLALY